MRVYKHNPHPIDLSDFTAGRNVILGGRDFEREEHSYCEKYEPEFNSSTFKASVTKIRKSVMDRLFSIELKSVTF